MTARSQTCVQFMDLRDGRIRAVALHGAVALDQLRFRPRPHATIADAVGLAFWLEAVLEGAADPVFVVPWAVSGVANEVEASLTARCEAVLCGWGDVVFEYSEGSDGQA